MHNTVAIECDAFTRVDERGVRQFRAWRRNGPPDAALVARQRQIPISYRGIYELARPLPQAAVFDFRAGTLRRAVFARFARHQRRVFRGSAVIHRDDLARQLLGDRAERKLRDVRGWRRGAVQRDPRREPQIRQAAVRGVAEHRFRI